MQAEEIGLPENRVAFHKLCVQLAFKFNWRANRIVVNDAHAEPVRTTRYRAADTSETEDAQRLAPDIGAAELIEVPAFPPAGTGQRIAFNQPPRDRHQQSPGKVRSRFVEYARSVAGCDVVARAGVHIDIVISNRDISHCAQVRRGGEEFFVNLFGEKADQAVLIRDAPQDFRSRGAVRIAPIFRVEMFRELRPWLFEQPMRGKYLGPIHSVRVVRARREINISAGP